MALQHSQIFQQHLSDISQPTTATPQPSRINCDHCVFIAEDVSAMTVHIKNYHNHSRVICHVCKIIKSPVPSCRKPHTILTRGGHATPHRQVHLEQHVPSGKSMINHSLDRKPWKALVVGHAEVLGFFISQKPDL